MRETHRHQTRPAQHDSLTSAPDAPRHVVLVGLSGSGKSTVGRLLAARLGRPFVDTDDMIVQAAGAPIPDIFSQRGEPAFRSLERAAVARAVAGQPAVIATGGGAPVDETNRRALWEGNLVIWLDAPVEALAARLGAGGAGRPLLAAGGPALRLAALREARAPVYRAAHARLDTASLSPDEAAATVAGLLQGGRPPWQTPDERRWTMEKRGTKPPEARPVDGSR